MEVPEASPWDPTACVGAQASPPQLSFGAGGSPFILFRGDTLLQGILYNTCLFRRKGKGQGRSQVPHQVLGNLQFPLQGTCNWQVHVTNRSNSETGARIIPKLKIPQFHFFHFFSFFFHFFFSIVLYSIVQYSIVEYRIGFSNSCCSSLSNFQNLSFNGHKVEAMNSIST